MPEYSGDISTVGEVDRYYFYFEAGHQYYIELEGAATGQGTQYDPYFYLRNFAGAFLTWNDDGGVGLNARMVFVPTVTDYYLVDAMGGNTGSYRLRVNEDDLRDTPEGLGPLHDLGNASLPGWGLQYDGNIDFNGDRDLFAVYLTAGKTYYLEQTPDFRTTPLYDSYLRLLTGTGAGTLVAEDDDSGGSGVGISSRIIYTPTTSGTYYLQAGGYGDRYKGSFLVYAHEDDYRDTPFGIGAAGEIASGHTRDGNLQVSYDADIFVTHLIGGLSYQLDEYGKWSTNKTLYGGELFIYDELGALDLFTLRGGLSDETGEYADVKATITPPTTGTYYVKVHGYDDLSGTFILGISAGVGSSAKDSITGTNYTDAIEGAGGDDVISGRGGDDDNYGGLGSDRIAGDAGNDLLNGGSGNDTLNGGAGRDSLIGSAGNDRFVFSVTGSKAGAMDVVYEANDAVAFERPGAAAGDVIDLGAIDARSTTAANDAFVFGGVGVGRIWLTETGANTIVHARTDSDPTHDLVFAIDDLATRSTSYTAADFIL